MNIFTRRYFFRCCGALAQAVVFLTACSEKKNPIAPQTDTLTSAPPSAVSTPTVAPNARLAEVQSALDKHDYERATDTLLALQQQKRLTDEQALALQNQMRKLQSDLANAIANGDAKAKAAADKLRRASAH